MPGVKYCTGQIIRIPQSIPFFMRDEPFDGNLLSGIDYSWFKKPMILFGKTRFDDQRTPLPNQHMFIRAEDDSSIGDIVAGNPLECPFNPNENFEEVEKQILAGSADSAFPRLDFYSDKYQPLDVHGVRTLMRKLNAGDENVLNDLGLSRTSKDVDPIYFMCEPDSKGLIMIGFHKQSSAELKINGPFYCELASFGLDYFLRIHTPIPFPSDMDKGLRPQVQQQVHVVYDIVGGEYAVKGRVFFEFSWPEPTDLFGKPPAGSKSKIAIWPKPGDANVELGKFWKEILKLEELITIYESDQVPDYHRTYYHRNQSNISIHLEESTNAVVDGIRELVQQPATSSWSISKDSITPLITDLLQAIIRADRADVDFTDKAWTILKDAPGIPEIYEGMFEIFVNIERAYWRPYLLPTNKTSLGNIIKDLRSEKLSNFRTILTPRLALELTIEFGIMKLERDFSFLCTMCQMMDLNEIPSVLNNKNYGDSLLVLKKLHCLVETICLAKDKFGLLSNDHYQFSQCMYRQLDMKVTFGWNNVYYFDLPNDHLLPLVINTDPIYWCLRLETKGACTTSRTNIVLSRDRFISQAPPPTPSMDKIESDTSEEISRRPWYSCVFRTMSRRQV